MADVLIIYAARDGARVRDIAKALGEAGLRVWRTDADSADEGAFDAREAALWTAPAILVVLSRAALASRCVIDEGVFARSLGKSVTVRIDASTPPKAWGDMAVFDLLQLPVSANPRWPGVVRALTKLASGDAQAAPLGGARALAMLAPSLATAGAVMLGFAGVMRGAELGLALIASGAFAAAAGMVLGVWRARVDL